MLKARSSFRTLAKNRAISPPPPSRQGRRFPLCRGNPVVSLGLATRQSCFDQLNSVPSIHMRCRMTASLRATATLALRSPLRLASLVPQAFTANHFGTCVSRTRLLQIDNFAASRRRIWRFGRTNRPPLRRGVYWLIRHKLRRFSIAQTVPDLKNSKIVELRKSRRCRALAISAVARQRKLDTSASNRFCGN